MFWYMGTNQKSGMDRSAVIRTMDREYLRKVPDPYPFVRAHYSIQNCADTPRLAITSPPATVAAKTVTTACRGSRRKNSTISSSGNRTRRCSSSRNSSSSNSSTSKSHNNKKNSNLMVVAAVAAAVVLGVVGVGVGIAAAAEGAGGGGAGGVVVVVAAAIVIVVVEAAAAAVEVVIQSDFHIGICCGVTGFGYGSGMERVWIGVWIGTRYLGRLSRYGCEGFKSSLVLHVPGKAETEGVVIIAPLEVQEAPSGTKTNLTSLQGTLATLVVATQLVAFVQLPEVQGGSEPAPATRAGPAGAAAAEATAIAAAPGRKITSSGSSSSTEAARRQLKQQ